MRFHHGALVLAFHFLSLGAATAAWPGHRTPIDSESSPDFLYDSEVAEVEVVEDGDAVSEERVGGEPICPPGCAKAVCGPDCAKRVRLKPLLGCGSVGDCQSSMPRRLAVGRDGRQGHPDLLSALGFHPRLVAGSSPTGRVPVRGMPRGAIGPWPSGAPYPIYGGVVWDGQEYPTSVPQGLRRSSMNEEELLLDDAVVVPHEPTPAAAPPQTNSSTARAMQNASHASLDTPTVELNTPDKTISGRPKPSSKFDPIKP